MIGYIGKINHLGIFILSPCIGMDVLEDTVKRYKFDLGY